VIDHGAFAEGLTRIGVACRTEVTEPMFSVYFDAVAPQTTAGEWSQFATAVVAAGRWEHFPSVRAILDALCEYRGQRVPEAEAIEAYERVIAAANWTPEAGASWNYRDVLTRCGRASAEAFLAAGGHNGFVSCWDEVKRRTAFVRGYATAVRDDPSTQLLPAAAVPQLPPGDDGQHHTPPDEARALLQQIAGTAPSRPEARRVVHMSQEEWNERLAVLRRQAEEMR